MFKRCRAIGTKHSILKDLEERYARQQADGRDIAVIYSGLGDKSKVFEWLEKDFQARRNSMVELRMEDAFDSLRDDPRFKEMLKRLNLPE